MKKGNGKEVSPCHTPVWEPLTYGRIEGLDAAASFKDYPEVRTSIREAIQLLLFSPVLPGPAKPSDVEMAITDC